MELSFATFARVNALFCQGLLVPAAQPRQWRDVPGETNANGAPMERELTPVEARSGVVSGRVLTILVISSVGAVAALALAWLFLFP
jgi:hypothetical protein